MRLEGSVGGRGGVLSIGLKPLYGVYDLDGNDRCR
jgi:hypothetical protein